VGGEKHLESVLFVAAFNHFPEEEFFVFLKSLPWFERRLVQVMIKRQADEVWRTCGVDGEPYRVKPPVPSIWKLVQTPNKTPHCSTFPLDLPMQCISAAAVEGRGVVLDPFMGSGTSGRAARLSGHEFLGFELDAKTCAFAHDYISAPAANSLRLFEG